MATNPFLCIFRAIPVSGQEVHMRSDVPRVSSSRRSGPTEDERLLAAPVAMPERRPAVTSTDPWRVLRIMGEFVEGFDTLATVKDGVTIFGSARTKLDDPVYAATVETA